MYPPSNSQSPPGPPEDDFEAAFRVTAPERQSLREKDLLPVNVDIAKAVSIALDAARQLEPFRSEMAELPRFDVTLIDRLGTMALALSHAQTLCSIALQSERTVKEAYEEGVLLRAQLLEDLKPVIRRGLLHPSRLQNLRGPVGYNNLSEDLRALAELLSQIWSEIGGRTLVTEQDIRRARELGTRLLTRIAVRKPIAKAVAACVDQRARAFTLLVRSYDEIRIGIAFVRRRDGDAERIAPSLYSARKTRKRAKPEPTPVGSELQQPAGQAAVPPEPQPQAGAVAPAPFGWPLPGSDPFVAEPPPTPANGSSFSHDEWPRARGREPSS